MAGERQRFPNSRHRTADHSPGRAPHLPARPQRSAAAKSCLAAAKGRQDPHRANQRKHHHPPTSDHFALYSPALVSDHSQPAAFTARCTCPVLTGCKHAVALMLSLHHTTIFRARPYRNEKSAQRTPRAGHRARCRGGGRGRGKGSTQIQRGANVAEAKRNPPTRSRRFYSSFTHHRAPRRHRAPATTRDAARLPGTRGAGSALRSAG